MTERCAPAARERGEPVGGSASRARRWLLVEQPGSWGRDAIRGSGLPDGVADHLEAMSRDLPARVLLLRRTGGGGTPGPQRAVFAGVSHQTGGGWLERLWLDDLAELPALDLTPLSHGRSVGGEPVTDPLYLVCTNGKHDACCATFGLPVAQAVARLWDERTWECSHVGGDRFAGNLVCLPDGIFYGHLDPDSARDAVTAHEDGRMLLPYCRGRSALPFPVQAAELLARQRLAIEALDGMRYLDHRRDGASHRVRFLRRDNAEVVVATVRTDRDHARRVLTCGTAPVAPPRYTLTALTTEPAGD